ncbi:bifunctional 4-hydroxy-2-oxoglutarate aldolase/2-dehydro-3-deoxy-phosphogluconate aldolase [Sorangium sp. So ce1036]|uniref:bifunctional 4-hydroxy-2-oxoglutarate aldolase/2-dehydro-3-deoxy-phosphogluconate aldolase n=1 Tax=Sorangium sp. So ce1036 TaxID=3133328 RepID=UPI003F024D2C
MNKGDVLAWIRRTRVVPIVRTSSAELAFRAVEALIEGGLDVLEITMTVPGAVEVVREISARHGDRALVGAGTVLDPATAEACVEAGARFIVSPALDEPTLRACLAMNVVHAPGALTPTEIVAAHRAGGDVIKVFPCDALGGAAYLKAVKAPLPHIPLMPTGGATLDNVGAFLAAGAEAVGVGTSLVDLGLLREGRREELVARARAFREACRPSDAR